MSVFRQHMEVSACDEVVYPDWRGKITERCSSTTEEVTC